MPAILAEVAHWKIIPVALALLIALVTGCSQGDSIPLVAPGGSDTWPTDAGWRTVGGLFEGVRPLDGVADLTTGTVVVVGTGGAILEHDGEQWSRPAIDLHTALRSVLSLGGDEFLAVGDQGRIWRRSGGQWLSEESGTTAGLNLVIGGSEAAWAVGVQGTVLRWDAAGWQVLPVPTVANLVSAAVVNDSLFVVSDQDRNEILVWDGVHWGSVSGGPWVARRVAGVATVFGDHLYAATDSLYVRDPAGWRTITDFTFWDFGDNRVFASKVVDHTLWYRYGSSWYTIDPSVAPRQPRHPLPYDYRTVAPLGSEDYLTVNDRAQVYWVKSGERRLDPAGEPRIYETIGLTAGGLLMNMERGIVSQDGTGLVTILAAAERDSVMGGWVQAGCGRDVTDFYLGTRHGIYHYQDGQLTTVGTWPESHGFTSLAQSGDGEFHLGDNSGFWRWTGTDLVEDRPLGVPEDPYSYYVWTAGNGDLVARDPGSYFYRFEAGQWLPLGRLRHDAVVQEGADGSLVAISWEDRSDGNSGNTLRVYDQRAGAFRSLGAKGMGMLQSMHLAGGLSHNGELLVWTGLPTMVFRLNGDPRRTDWEIVAGPVDADIKHLAVLADGSLLGLDTSGHSFHLYQR